MAVCPKCGGTNIQFQRETVGTFYNSSYKQTGVKRSWIFPSDIRKGRQTIDYKTVGFCGDCGYTWEIEKDGKRSAWRYFFFLILWPIALSMWFWKTQRCGWIKDGEPLYYRRHGLLSLLLARCPVKKQNMIQNQTLFGRRRMLIWISLNITLTETRYTSRIIEETARKFVSIHRMTQKELPCMSFPLTEPLRFIE